MDACFPPFQLVVVVTQLLSTRVSESKGHGFSFPLWNLSTKMYLMCWLNPAEVLCCVLDIKQRSAIFSWVDLRV